MKWTQIGVNFNSTPMTCCIFYQIICNQVSNDGFFPPAPSWPLLSVLLINDTISHQPVVEAGRWLLVSGYEKKKFDVMRILILMP
eukprot:UN16501